MTLLKEIVLSVEQNGISISCQHKKYLIDWQSLVCISLYLITAGLGDLDELPGKLNADSVNLVEEIWRSDPCENAKLVKQTAPAFFENDSQIAFFWTYNGSLMKVRLHQQVIVYLSGLDAYWRNVDPICFDRYDRQEVFKRLERIFEVKTEYLGLCGNETVEEIIQRFLYHAQSYHHKRNDPLVMESLKNRAFLAAFTSHF